MGDNSNSFHCDIVRTHVEKLLRIDENNLILDRTCGNGNFSERMAKQGAVIVAFDYRSKMIELAIKRRQGVLSLQSTTLVLLIQTKIILRINYMRELISKVSRCFKTIIIIQ